MGCAKYNKYHYSYGKVENDEVVCIGGEISGPLTDNYTLSPTSSRQKSSKSSSPWPSYLLSGGGELASLSEYLAQIARKNTSYNFIHTNGTPLSPSISSTGFRLKRVPYHKTKPWKQWSKYGGLAFGIAGVIYDVASGKQVGWGNVTDLSMMFAVPKIPYVGAPISAIYFASNAVYIFTHDGECFSVVINDRCGALRWGE